MTADRVGFSTLDSLYPYARRTKHCPSLSTKDRVRIPALQDLRSVFVPGHLLTSNGIGKLQGFEYHSTLLHSTEMRNDSKRELMYAHIHISVRRLGRTKKRYAET